MKNFAVEIFVVLYTPRLNVCPLFRVKFHILQTFLHIVQLTIGYLLMLAVMTYNAYFTLAVVGGAGLGYYFFALFDLPSKILGSHMSRPAQCPAGSSPPHLSEGNVSIYYASYGAAGSVVSPVGSRVSSQLEQRCHSKCEAGLGENRVQEGGRARVSDSLEGEIQAPTAVMCGEDEPDGLRGASAVVDVSDQACLLPQDTIRVEVQVHAFPDE